MRLIFTVILFTFFISCSSPEDRRNPLTIDQFSWMLGKWEMDTGEGLLWEEWQQVNDSTFVGESYVLDSAGTKIVLEEVGFCSQQGGFFYIPSVKNQNEGKSVAFKLTAIDSTGFTAENSTHDFPQRIIYRFHHPDRLDASIEGKQNGNFRKENFPMKKVNK